MRCAYGRKESLEAILLRPVSFGDDVRSISFNGRDSDPATLKAFGPGKTRIEAGSVSFNGRRKNPNCNNTSLKSPTFKPENASPLKRGPLDSSSPKHQAAVKLQKVYKSFRTRRQLADCAVLVEQIWRRWSQVLDFAMLKQSSVSFFERPESAFSRWSRARRRAAMVGKGLSKNEKAQKLALQHWLEAIDPRHRYGHNLHFYYDCWLQCESTEPFFYWLDVGEGKEVNLKEQCPRSMLQQQCIKYLDRNEREAYEVVIEDGKFIYKQSRQILDTSGGINDEKWIFVLSTSGALYVGQKMKGKFQHSSFLAGGATCAAGQLEVENGVLKTVWPHSGHYRPTAENFQQFMSFLEENKVDLTDVKTCGKGGTDELCGEPEVNFAGKTSNDEAFGDMKSIDKQIIIVEHHDEGEEEVEVINVEHKASNNTSNLNKFYSFRPRNLLAKGQEDDDDEEEEEEEEAAAFRAPSHTIPGRINSNKLRNQLPLTWTTGAGPRIQCVRDYPSELQFRALAQMCLSPRCGPPVNASKFDSQRRIEDIRLYQ